MLYFSALFKTIKHLSLIKSLKQSRTVGAAAIMRLKSADGVVKAIAVAGTLAHF